VRGRRKREHHVRDFDWSLLLSCVAIGGEFLFLWGEILFVFLFAQQPSLVKTAMRKSGKYLSREVNVMNSF
jgi:hypothetical protein